MGGWGSGRWDRRGARRLVESCSWISAGALVRSGAIGPGISGTIRLGEPTWAGGAIACGAESGRLALAYAVRVGTGPTSRIDEDIELATSRPHLGGLRWWFVCPGCGGRAARLYLARALFRCRACHRLVYRSHRDSHKDERMLARSERRTCPVGGAAGVLIGLLELAEWEEDFAERVIRRPRRGRMAARLDRVPG